MAFFFQLCSLLGFTIGNSLWHKPVQKLPITFIIAAKSLFTSVLFLVVLIAIMAYDQQNKLGITHSFNNINIWSIGYSIGLCAISFWGLYFFNHSLKHTASGITITVAGMGTIVGFLVALFVYHEKITPTNIISSILGLIGLWFLEKLNPSFFKLKFTKGMLFGLLSMLFWRIGTLFPLAIDKVGVMLFSLILELTVFLISIILFVCSRGYNYTNISNIKPYFWIIVSIALSNFAGILGNHLSLKFASMVDYTILGFLAPIVTFSISLFFYKEKYTLIQYLGILIIIFGGLVLNYVAKLI